MRSCFVAASCWLTEDRCYVDHNPWRSTCGEWLEKLTGCVDVTLDNRVVLAAS